MTPPTKAERREAALKAYLDVAEPAEIAYEAATGAARKAYQDALSAAEEEP